MKKFSQFLIFFGGIFLFLVQIVQGEYGEPEYYIENFDLFAPRQEYYQTCVAEVVSNMVDYIRVQNKRPMEKHTSSTCLILDQRIQASLSEGAVSGVRKLQEGDSKSSIDRLFDRGLDVCRSFKYAMNQGVYLKEDVEDQIENYLTKTLRCLYPVQSENNINDLMVLINNLAQESPYYSLLAMGRTGPNINNIPGFFLKMFEDSSDVDEFAKKYEYFKSALNLKKIKSLQKYSCQKLVRKNPNDFEPLEKIKEYAEKKDYRLPLTIEVCGYGFMPGRGVNYKGDPFHNNDLACGKHEMILVGHRTDENSQKQYAFLNTWGKKGYGQGGAFADSSFFPDSEKGILWISEGYLKQNLVKVFQVELEFLKK